MYRLSYAQRQWLLSEVICQYRTSTDFARLHKFSTDTIGKLVNGGRLRLETIRRALRVLGIDAQDFFAADLMEVA